MEKIQSNDEYSTLDLHKRLDRLETKQDMIFSRIKAFEIYMDVKKATNHINKLEKEKKEQYWLKIRFMIFGILLTLITILIEKTILR